MAHGNKEMPLDSYPFMDNDLKSRGGGVTPEEFNALKEIVLQNTSNISNLSEQVSTNTGDISDLSGEVSTNTSDISDLLGQVNTTTITLYKNDDILNIITPQHAENILKINSIEIIENLNTRQLIFNIEFLDYNYFVNLWNNTGNQNGFILGTVTEQFRPNKLIFGGNGRIIGQISTSGATQLRIPILPTETLSIQTVSFTYIKKRV